MRCVVCCSEIKLTGLMIRLAVVSREYDVLQARLCWVCWHLASSARREAKFETVPEEW